MEKPLVPHPAIEAENNPRQGQKAALDFQVIIPARYAATRLPGKPLLDIGGKPMLQHVFERAQQSGARRVIIATDDERIQQAAQAFGADVYMTDPQHPSGTDRIAEIARICELPDTAIIVNVQGDEPCLPPALIQQVAQALNAHPQAAVATLCETITDPATLFNPNVVKVVRDRAGFALYFSRAPIPWVRDSFQMQPLQGATGHAKHFRHIGLYAYRAAFLQTLTQMPVAPLESDEALEQLRVLYQGHKIYVTEAQETPARGVDTAEDLEKIRAFLS